MSKVQKALGKLRHKTVQAESLAKQTRNVHKRALSLNNTLNATVVEQNERLDLLAGNCRHYRERLSESEDRINDVTDKNSDLYSRLQKSDKAHASLICDHRAQSSTISKLRTEATVKAEELAEAQHYLRLSRLTTIAVTLAWVATAAGPLISKLFG